MCFLLIMKRKITKTLNYQENSKWKVPMKGLRCNNLIEMRKKKLTFKHVWFLRKFHDPGRVLKVPSIKIAPECFKRQCEVPTNI